MSSPTRFLVLGAGRVGSAIARDLAADPAVQVTAADRDAGRAQAFPADSGVTFQQADLGQAQGLTELVEPYDLVIGAVPGWMGFETVKTALLAGKHVVDISFFEQDPFELDALAKERGLTAVVDCGVAPGLSNLIVGRWEREFERIDRFTCLVGGLPEAPTPPWNYKAPYSPADVIEMYTRPARLVRGGKVITLPALTENEPIDFPGVGRLEAFNTDGLRTLLTTSSIPDLKEKTLRYPGHCDQISLLVESGFFDEEREVRGQVIRPRDVSTPLLFEQWYQGPDDHDVTAMRLEAEGLLNGRYVRRTYDLCDHADRERGITSMARTTGYPCASMARMVTRGDYRRPGISPPEFVGADERAYATLLADLAERGVKFNVTEREIAAPQAAAR